MTDSVSQMVSIIKNGYLAKKGQVSFSYSKFREQILKVLLAEGFIGKVSLKEDKKKRSLVIDLKYNGKEPAINEIRVVSKPGLRIYRSARGGRSLMSGLGKRILSTPGGVLTDIQAAKKNFGGEVILEVY